MTSRAHNPPILRSHPPGLAPPSANPRRTTAKRSVSIVHPPQRQPSRLQTVTTPGTDNDCQGEIKQGASSGASGSPSSLQALGGKGSSGESSNAEKWFDKSNNDVQDNSASFADNDPPFFMRNSSSSQTPPDAQLHGLSAARDGAQSLPLHTGLLHLGTDGSSTEDYRGVIDDLTIENKKLKRRLKKYERLHDSHLKDEKLFEVRFHGLPPDRKKELEETLRKFASTLSTGGATNAFPPDGYASLMSTLKPGKGTSSQTSLQQTDSAYASMSASGQGSSGPSGNDRKMTPSQYPAVRRQNIHNYLHHIPEGLLPQQSPAAMTERSKRKMVVRRLEQLFAGKGALAGGNQHSIQQEEVSQSAARTDRSAMEEAGHRARQEGTREAHIMDEELKEPQPKEESLQSHLAEQRPTRPLDLDPHRAQVPAENIRYLRQMGFSPRDPETVDVPEGHGWIYLNFLINMAQLHTINVTTEFVRKAVAENSNKFEVSEDGRKVRWRGGNSITRSSDSGATSSSTHTGNNSPDGQSPRKRQKLSHTDARLNVQQSAAPPRLQSEYSRHAYTPLFHHRSDSDADDDSSSSEEEDDSMFSPYPRPQAGDSSAMTSSGIRTSSGLPVPSTKKKQPKHDDGPIIFYNNAKFCTDLSGDRRGHANYSAPSYVVASSLPIGKSRIAVDGDYEKRGPLTDAADLPEPMDLSDNPIPESMELSFPDRSPHGSPIATKEQRSLDLEVTGIGGVWPSDHFSISVQSRHVRVEGQPISNNRTKTVSRVVPPRFAKILQGSGPVESKPQRLQEQVVTTEIQVLPPSKLPPALNFMALGGDSDIEDDSDAGDEESEAPESLGGLPPATAPQPVEIPYGSLSDDEDDEEDDEDEADDETDGEIDFLAAARAAEPEAVRRQEREYEANMAERLADEIPAGSSAATAGGGSGFASPASGVDRAEYRKAQQQARENSAKVNRAKASGVKVVDHAKDSTSSNNSNDEEQVSDVGS